MKEATVKTLTKTEIRRWKEVAEKPLMAGGHEPDGQFCVMEMVAFVAGEDWTDSPECASPVIASFLRSWNDGLDDDQRQMLKPYVLKVVGSKGTPKQENERAWMATDWLARECAPAFLRLAGLTEHAEALESLAALTSDARALEAQPRLSAAESAAWSAAGSAAESAARSAAESAAWSAAWSAAGSAAESAARSAAESAAWSAAGSAARSAAGSALAPTVAALQTSALLLLDRMIAVTA